MRISKLLKKKIYFFLFFVIFSNSIANEPADIWNIDKSETSPDQNISNEALDPEEISEETISVYDLNNQIMKIMKLKFFKKMILKKNHYMGCMILTKIIYRSICGNKQMVRN